MILVTGATGFLGYHLIPLLQERGFSVRALVRSTSNVAQLTKHGVELATVQDITDADGVAKACEGCKVVIHGAGLFRFWGKRKAFWHTNVDGTQTVLGAAENAGISRFIHISTVAVVGKPPPNTIVDERTACHPQDAYQESKLAAEKLVQEAVGRGLPALILRPGGFYGAGGQYAINRLFFEEPLRGWRIQVNRGKHLTFPVFVPDVAQAVLLSLERGRVGEIYNICGKSLTHQQLNHIVSEIAGISPFRFPVPRIVALGLARLLTTISTVTHREPFYATNLAHYVFQDWHISSQKAQKELSFMPTPFADGAKETLNWYWNAGILKRRSSSDS